VEDRTAPRGGGEPCLVCERAVAALEPGAIQCPRCGGGYHAGCLAGARPRCVRAICGMDLSPAGRAAHARSRGRADGGDAGARRELARFLRDGVRTLLLWLLPLAPAAACGWILERSDAALSAVEIEQVSDRGEAYTVTAAELGRDRLIIGLLVTYLGGPAVVFVVGRSDAGAVGSLGPGERSRRVVWTERAVCGAATLVLCAHAGWLLHHA